MVQHNPESPLRYFWSGRVWETLGDLDQAVNAYRTYTAAQPKWAEGWRRLGQVQLELKRYDRAVKSFNRAMSIEPSNETRRQRREAQSKQ